MAYLGYCKSCNHLKASVYFWSLYEYFVDHTRREHDDRFTIVRITAKEYMAYLENRDNPAFWKAWNNKAKPEPPFV